MKDEAEKHINPTKIRLTDEDEILAEHLARIKDVPKAVLFRMFVRQGLRMYRLEQQERSLKGKQGIGSGQEAPRGHNYAELRLAE